MRFRQANVLPAHGPTSFLTRIVIEAIAFITSFTLGGPRHEFQEDGSEKISAGKCRSGRFGRGSCAVHERPDASDQRTRTSPGEGHRLRRAFGFRKLRAHSNSRW